MKRKIASLVLAAAMAVNMVSVPVMATEVIADNTVEIVDVVETVDSAATETIADVVIGEDEAFIEVVNEVKEASKDYDLTSDQINDKENLAAHLADVFGVEASSVGEYAKKVDIKMGSDPMVDIILGSDPMEMPATPESIGGAADSYEFEEGKVVYGTDSREDAERVAEMLGGSVESFSYGIAVIKLPEGITTAQAVCASALLDTNIPSVYPNGICYSVDYDAVDIIEGVRPQVPDPINYVTQAGSDPVGSVPTDPFISKDSGSNYQYFIDFVGAKEAWEAGYTGRGIKVAVLDSGVAQEHADLKTNALTGRDFLNGASGEPVTTGQHPHGTHVSGIVAADDNGILGCGVAPDATVQGFVVLNSNNRGTWVDLTRAFNAVAEDGSFDIVNCSIGGYGYDANLEKAVLKCYNAGVAIFVSAGNDNTTNNSYPAAYKGAISIASLDKKGLKSSFSNYGDTVDFCFPGSDIYSCNMYDLEGYTFMSGTSMASPCGAGVAAVLMQAKPELRGNVEGLIKVMKEGAKKSPSQTTYKMGAGYTYLPKALSIPTKPEGTPVTSIEITSVTDTVAAGKSFTVQVKVLPENATNKNVQLSAKGTNGKIKVKGNKITAAKSASGEYTIYVSSEDGAVLDVPFTFTVTKGGIKKITLNKKKVNIFAKEGNFAAPTSYTLSAKVKGSKNFNENAYTFTSSNPSVATVDATGKITAVSLGKATITCKSVDGTGKKASCQITVCTPMSSLTIGKGGDFSLTEIPVKRGKTAKLQTKAGSDFGTPTFTAVKWSSDNSKIKVNKSGVVSVAKSAKPGDTATITATAKDGSNVSASVTIVVQ